MNPWQKIPYSDYEKHMKNENVYQLQTLNKIFKTHLKSFQPKSLLVLGCGGGNGFEHIDDQITKRVIGLDINSSYLEICNELYSVKKYSLKLINSDFDIYDASSFQVDFISCSLFLEYVNIESAILKMIRMLKNNSHLSIVIQRSNKVNFVSNTNVESLNVLEEIAKEIDEKNFEKLLIKYGLNIIAKKVFILPNKKELVDYLCTLRKY